MSLSHLKNAVAEPRRLSAPVARRHVYAASRINRHRARAVANVDTASFEAEVLQVTHRVRTDLKQHVVLVAKPLRSSSGGRIYE